VANRPELREIVAKVARTHSLDVLAVIMDRASIPFSPVRRPTDLFDDPQLNAHGRMLNTKMVNGMWAKLPSLPFTIDGETPKLRLQPPQSGEQTDDVLAEFGYSPERIAELRRDKIVT
jgi:crotonobetainyl-CoA:carnitine CoA-transferase CaiB-like acyl-CoA transferase